MIEATDDGDVIYPDATMIREAVAYDVTKQSLIFSLRFLCKRGLLMKTEKIMQRQRWVVPYAPTEFSFDYFNKF